MGCDYYVVTILEIFQKSPDGSEEPTIVLEYDRDPRYYPLADYDSNSEGEKRRYQEELHECLRRYQRTKVLFQDGEWKISSYDKIDHYKDFIKENGDLDMESISKIVKKTYPQQR